MERSKQFKDFKIWLEMRMTKGWELENAGVNVQRGGLVSIYSSPAILFVCAYAACSLCYTGFQAVCDVLFYLLVS